MSTSDFATVVLPALPRQLKRLDLRSDHFLCPAACVDLRGFWLSPCDDPEITYPSHDRRSFLTDLHVNTIAASLPNLRTLNLDTPADITAACVEHVASTLPHLTALSLWSDAVTWESAALLLALLPSLQRLSLVSGALVPRASPQPGRAEAGAAAARDTSANAAAGAEAVGSDALSIFASLSLAPPSAGDPFWCPSGSSLAPCLASIRLHLFRHLTTLDLSRTDVLRPPPPPDGEPGRSEEALCRAIRGLPLLERLALPLASDAVLLEISQSCPKLTALHAQPLARFVPVASAEGSGSNDFLYYTSAYARASVRVALPAVQPRVTDAGVLAIANGCTRLVQLSLGGCVNVGPVGLRQLARRCGRLEVLRLARTRVDDAAVVAALVTSALLLALSAAARELADNDEKTRDEGVGHEKGRKKVRGCCGLQEFRLRRLLVSPEVIGGDWWSGSKDGGCEGVVGGGGDGGGVDSGSDYVDSGSDYGSDGGDNNGGDGGGDGGGVGSDWYVYLRLVAREVGMLLPKLVVTARRTAEHVLPWDGFFGERKLELDGDDDESE
ncbi:unnamed protein product [Closterium sp. Naga37s-1]|nr:unnamed protein product [Closterium sp. Naga37s-1]